MDGVVSFDPFKKDPIYYLTTYIRLKKSYKDINRFINSKTFNKSDLKLSYITNFRLFYFSNMLDYMEVCKSFLNKEISHFYIISRGDNKYSIHFKTYSEGMLCFHVKTPVNLIVYTKYIRNLSVHYRFNRFTYY